MTFSGTETLVDQRFSKVGHWLPGAYLAGEDLRMHFAPRPTGGIVYLAGADLTGANLSGIDLTGFVLCGAKLAGADLESVTIGVQQSTWPSANFAGADMTGCSLVNSRLRRVSFRGASMTGIAWTGCDVQALGLHDLQSIGCDFTAATYDRRTGDEFLNDCGGDRKANGVVLALGGGTFSDNKSQLAVDGDGEAGNTHVPPWAKLL